MRMFRRSLLAAPALLSLPVRAQGTLKMTIATGVDPSFAPFYVGKEGGFFEKHGLDLTVNTGPSGSAMVAFLIGDQINAAFGAEQAGVSAHLRDPNVVVVAEGTTLLRWMSVLARNIDSMEGLKGKKIGVARGTGSETFWLSVVDKLKLNPADYTIVNVEAPEMVAALERGNIDAFAVWEPWPTRAQKAIPNTKSLVNNETIQIIRNLITMNKAWAEAHPDHTSRFLRALVEANNFIETNREQAVQQVARFLRQDRALIAELMTKVRYPLDLTPETAGNVQLAIDQLRGMGKLAHEVTPAEIIWPAPLKAVAPERVRL
jgi:NitT/TauT family transport system substrate-binding protein